MHLTCTNMPEEKLKEALIKVWPVWGAAAAVAGVVCGLTRGVRGGAGALESLGGERLGRWDECSSRGGAAVVRLVAPALLGDSLCRVVTQPSLDSSQPPLPAAHSLSDSLTRTPTRFDTL